MTAVSGVDHPGRRGQALHEETNNKFEISFLEFVALIAALMALTALSIDIMLPALPDIGSALGVKDANDQQLVVIVYMAGFGTGQLFCGALSDRFGRKPVLLAGLAIFLTGTLAALLSDSFTALLTARAVQGLGAASPRVVAIAVVRDRYSGRQMARVMSFAMMAFIIIPVFAPTVGQALLHLGNWRLMFVALLVMGVGLAFWSGLRLPETHPQILGIKKKLTIGQSFKAAVLEPQTIAYGTAGGFMFGCLLAYVASAQQIFVDVFKIGQSFPLVFGAIASAMAVASFINAGLVERYGMRHVSHIALAAFIVISLALVAVSLIELAGLAVFAALVATAFFLFGFIAPNFNALAMEPQGKNAGMASSVIGSISTAIGATCGGVIGASFDGTVLPLAAGFAGCSILAFALVVWVEGSAGLFGRGARKSLQDA
jgi:MFS transporter, DHA1 family, multidrug resistance protein